METKSNDYQYIDSNKEHLHTYQGQPLIGTSSVADVLKKDGLTWWASGLAVKEFGCTDGKVLTKVKNKKATDEEKETLTKSLSDAHERIKNMSLDEYMGLIDGAYRAHSVRLVESAKDGTDLHAELERFVKDTINGKHDIDRNGHRPADYAIYDEKIQPFIDWTIKNVKRFLWSEMHCYSTVYWLGGITDCGYEKHDGTIGIMDFKSSKEAYLSQFFQCAGYAIEVEENGGFTADGEKIFDLEGKKIQELAVFPFGMENPEPQFYVDIAKAKESFLAEVTLYKNMNIDK